MILIFYIFFTILIMLWQVTTKKDKEEFVHM